VSLTPHAAETAEPIHQQGTYGTLQPELGGLMRSDMGETIRGL
jgi:hypothetical protein